jgi:alpha-D-ribose 1-methylphosphonate 5-triphosphate synthase subunit PhnG
MFHAFDSSAPNQQFARADWLALLARAPLGLLQSSLGTWPQQGLHWLRRPETGLMMVQARAGGTGERFNVGEVTVTRCALRLQTTSTALQPSTQPAGQQGPQTAGVAWVLGRDARRCTLAAVADAMLQDPAHHERLCAELLQPTALHLRALAAQRQARAQSTQVNFFTLARESDNGSDTEDDE